MRRIAQLLITLVVLGAAGSAVAAGPRATPVSAGSTTAGVATLELIDPVARSGRSVPTENGIYFRICDRGPIRPCAIPGGAVRARRQAFQLALSTLRTTNADLVVVALPQTATRSALLVFERDLLDSPGLDPLRATNDRLYLMGGLVAYSGNEDSLILVRLRPSPAARWGR